MSVVGTCERGHIARDGFCQQGFSLIREEPNVKHHVDRSKPSSRSQPGTKIYVVQCCSTRRNEIFPGRKYIYIERESIYIYI